MNREILFKAKIINEGCGLDGQWVEGWYFYANSTKKHLIYTYNGGMREIDPETLCQLVQTDKVRVWEGDIVRWEGDDETISAIRYDKENARFVFDTYGIKGLFMEYGWDEDSGDFGKLDTNEFEAFLSFDFEVIGNVFDNPELLKHA